MCRKHYVLEQRRGQRSHCAHEPHHHQSDYQDREKQAVDVFFSSCVIGMRGVKHLLRYS